MILVFIETKYGLIYLQLGPRHAWATHTQAISNDNFSETNSNGIVKFVLFCRQNVGNICYNIEKNMFYPPRGIFFEKHDFLTFRKNIYGL